MFSIVRPESALRGNNFILVFRSNIRTIRPSQGLASKQINKLQ